MRYLNHSMYYHKHSTIRLNKRIDRTDGCSQNKRLYKHGCNLASLIVIMLCSGQYLSITKGNNSKIVQNIVMVIVHCIFSHRDLSTNEVSSWYLIVFVLCSGQNFSKKGQLLLHYTRKQLWFLCTALFPTKIYLPIMLGVQTFLRFSRYAPEKNTIMKNNKGQ